MNIFNKVCCSIKVCNIHKFIINLIIIAYEFTQVNFIMLFNLHLKPISSSFSVIIFFFILFGIKNKCIYYILILL